MVWNPESPGASADPKIRLRFWNSGGAQSVICSTSEAAGQRRRLVAEGAVLLQSEPLSRAA